MMSDAAQRVCRELTPLLRGYAQEFGLAPKLAKSLSLVWDGETFSAQSPYNLNDAEFGDGKGPSPRPVHKALNKLEPDAEKLLTDLVLGGIAAQTEAVIF